MEREYQLILQLPEDCPLTSLDFEDEIAEALGNPNDEGDHPHLVDGNSYGAGTIEFFIHTSDPNAAFKLVTPLLASNGTLGMVTAAYRKLSESSFTLLWPPGYKGMFRP